MTWKRMICLLTMALFVTSLSAPDALAKKKKKKDKRATKIATGPMDDGKLIPSWFGEELAFVETDEIDYFWVKEGFELEGNSFHLLEWPEVEFIGEKAEDRDTEDRALARRLNGDMHNIFRDGIEGALDDSSAASLDSGNVQVTGRIVDCSTGNVAAKAFVGFGAGAGNVTLDVKMTDAESGELLVALHHRVVSGTNWSTTDSKFLKWVRKAFDEMMDDGLQELYDDGDSVRK